MSVQPAPARKTPWLIIILAVLAALCLCAALIGAAVFAFFIPTSVSSTATEAPPVVIFETATDLPTEAPAAQTPESTNPLEVEAAPAGTAVDIGNNMTVTVLDVTRPADELVASGNSFNTTAPEGEEFLRVDVEVTCNNEAGTPCTFYPTVMKAILGDGSTRDLQTFLDGVEDWDTSLEINGGETQQGFLLFIVPKAESDLILSYNDIYADQPVYMQLP